MRTSGQLVVLVYHHFLCMLEEERVIDTGMVADQKIKPYIRINYKHLGEYAFAIFLSSEHPVE